MTTYRLFPSTNGPATLSGPGTGNFIAGVVFSVIGGGRWFDGYWQWVPPGGDTIPVKCALWSVHNAGSSTPGGKVVPGSVVTSGTLTANQWNFIPLSTPVQIGPGWGSGINNHDSTAYIAAIGWNVVNGFSDTALFWSAPIQNAAIYAYDGVHVGAAAGAPYGLPQGVFSVAGADPSVTMPTSQSGSDNLWVDVQLDDTAPVGYAGSSRIWPNMTDTNDVTIGDLNVNYTVGTEVHLTQSATLNNVWYFSPKAATTLATRCDVWNIGTGLSVASITSPSWTIDTGSAFTAGSQPYGAQGTWIKAAFAGGTTLPPGSYIVSVYNANGTTDANWNPKDAITDYWGQTTSGPGASGFTSGPIFVPGYASATAGFLYNASNTGATPPYNGGAAAHAQSVFGQLPSGLVDFPQLYAPVGAGTNQTQNYWVDLEVTPFIPPPTTLTPQRIPGRVQTNLGPNRRARQIQNYPTTIATATIPVFVSGLTANVTVASLAASTVNVPGLASGVTVAAPVGTFIGTVPGISASVTVTSQLGTPKVIFTGLSSAITVAAPVGTVSAGATISGLTANVTVASLLGTISVKVSETNSNITVASPVGLTTDAVLGLTSNITVAGQVGTSVINPQGLTANINVSALLGTISAGATISGLTANINVVAPVGTPISGQGVAGLVSSISVTAPTGTTSVRVSQSPASVTVAAPVGSARAGTTVFGVVANVTVSAQLGSAVIPVSVLEIISVTVSKNQDSVKLAPPMFSASGKTSVSIIATVSSTYDSAEASPVK